MPHTVTHTGHTTYYTQVHMHSDSVHIMHQCTCLHTQYIPYAHACTYFVNAYKIVGVLFYFQISLNRFEAWARKENSISKVVRTRLLFFRYEWNVFLVWGGVQQACVGMSRPRKSLPPHLSLSLMFSKFHKPWRKGHNLNLFGKTFIEEIIIIFWNWSNRHANPGLISSILE